MQNGLFKIDFNPDKGILTSLILQNDPERANFIKKGRGLFEPHGVPWYLRENEKFYKISEPYELESFEEEGNFAQAVFVRRGIKIEENFVLKNDFLRVQITIKNKNNYPFYFKKEDCAFYVPFADSYDNSQICQKLRCHAHIAAFGENSYVCAERMGDSEYNLGAVLVCGSAYSYSQEDCRESNDRGYFSLNISPFHLLSGETYKAEFVVFPHRGGEDFFVQAQKFTPYIRTEAADGYVIFKGETREFRLIAPQQIDKAQVKIGAKTLPCEVKNNVLTTHIHGEKYGEIRIAYTVNGRSGEAYFYVSPRLEELQKKRAKFIVRRQQCLEKNSPLYGAYLIYDNEENEQYFSFDWTDHNACRERMVMSLFLAKYARKTGDKEAAKSLDLFTEFLLRECVDEESGKSFNNIGKDASATRLYNAPWVIMYFAELYLLKGERRWIRLAEKMLIAYYKNGGTHFYPNGIRFYELAKAIEKSGDKQEYARILDLFDEHIEFIVKTGTNYPPHEVNFEQTIVTPAACLLLDKYLLTHEEKYLREAEKHLKILKKFHGDQPDYRMNKAPIRYWDNYWFGKTRSSVYGDTFPHAAAAHSAHCFYVYGVVTGQKKWIDYGKQCFASVYCCFRPNGAASSAYVYPERVNGEKGGFYDAFANEQDGLLYLAYKLSEEF